MALTYEKIATFSPSGSQSITFSSIPGTFTDLIIAGVGFASSESYYEIQFNSDTSNNYSSTYVYGTGSSPASGRQSNVANIAGTRIETQSTYVCHIMNYSNSTTYKTTLLRNSNAGQIVLTSVGLWRDTNAITSITLKSQITNFNSGSTFTLYGIKAA
jgi:hypothetical protein